MRRPTPLPVVPETPRPSRTRAPAPRTEERGAAEEQPMADPVSDPVAPTPEGAPEPDAPAPVSSRDVWRAARARRKALRAEIRRFTKASRRRRLAWLGGIGAVVTLILGCVVAAYSPLFALERITVVGTSALDAATVEAALSGQLGTPLALVDESEIKAALMPFPLIETYALEARPPHDLTVRIVERTPVGVIESGAGFTIVDAAGVALATTQNRPKGEPLLDIDGGVDSAAFTAAGLVVRSVPEGVREKLTRVTASSPDDVTLHLGSRTTVVWGARSSRR
ncbi:FtsQ-type POTRA domain-containing protein [Microbacterium sp. NIBRBAC000506063]|uniref:FtsQ-type POTRA domain-containing protein n=1 Tax=Microbacterium sp. NIBRBAC000506063 TaxID=2734618 RepID=UPI001CB6E74D|nr:FtsQ-type POTRA domain-containing protein [Microbacterium sp. NIBRBAC000506063]